mgnify:CR=1 FL=1
MDGMHPLIQFIFLASLSLTFLVIFTMTGMYLVRPLFGITTMDVVMQNALAHPDIVAQNINQLNALKFLQFMSSIGAFLIPAIFFAMLKFPGGDFLMLNRHIRFSLVIMAILILVISAPFISFTYEINQRLVLPSFMSNLEEMMMVLGRDALYRWLAVALFRLSVVGDLLKTYMDAYYKV